MIAGNGFDMAHGLKTGYKDFYDEYKGEIDSPITNLKKEIDRIIRKRKDASEPYADWYDFEHYIQEITLDNFQRNFEDGIDPNDYNAIERKQEEEYNRLFERLTMLLMDYLTEEVESKEIKLKDSIRAEVGDDTIAFTFNYTNILERYMSKVVHVHGSIEEDKHIILGFATDIIPDACVGEYGKYLKARLREELNFLRFLHGKRELEIASYMKEFRRHLDCLFSGRGGYDFPETYIVEENKVLYNSTEASEWLREYAETNKFEAAELEYDFSDVETVVIMGHGLKADLDFIREIFSKCERLRCVKLYSFGGEAKEELERKKEQIQSLNSEVRIEVALY